MSSVINILFLGGSKRVSIAEIFISTGIELNKEVRIFSYELNFHEPIGKVGKIIQGLKWTDLGISDDLIKTIVDNEIHLVVPFVDIATVLCESLKRCCPGVYFSCSSEYINRTMFDKKLANEWFVKNKILVPSTELKLPLVAKLVTGSGGKRMKYLLTKNQLEVFLKEEPIEDYFLQEMIQGDEYSVDCYVNKSGKPISIVPRLRIEITNGEATKSKTIRDPEIIALSEMIVTSEGFNGPVTIQFMRDKLTGNVYLIEINPRLGSGVLTSIIAGANVCKFILNDCLDIRNQAVTDWKENLLMTRTYKEYYFLCN